MGICCKVDEFDYSDVSFVQMVKFSLVHSLLGNLGYESWACSN